MAKHSCVLVNCSTVCCQISCVPVFIVQENSGGQVHVRNVNSRSLSKLVLVSIVSVVLVVSFSSHCFVFSVYCTLGLLDFHCWMFLVSEKQLHGKWLAGTTTCYHFKDNSSSSSEPLFHVHIRRSIQKNGRTKLWGNNQRFSFFLRYLYPPGADTQRKKWG